MSEETNNSNDFSGRLCSFEELVMGSDGQMIDIIVPKIQRSYAQGRKREKNIRESFVSQIIDSLVKGEDMELNFIYGSKTKKESSTTFELLDGQQRLTTLFLFYWYFSMVEGERKLPDALKHFTYETRTTSADFIKKLVESTIDISKGYPRESIKGKKWYTISFDKDPTVVGMLTMLDTIHEKYIENGKPNGMLANLSKIRFYELPLDNFGLTEEIYIKMNARGLQLTPFENFKADLVKYMKDEKSSEIYKETVEMGIVGSPNVPYYLSFVQKMDSKWLELFWSKDDKDNNAYCDKFFRFFYRYLSTKYYLEVRKEANAKEFRPNNIAEWDFLRDDSETQSSDNIDNSYLGFEIYKKILDTHPLYIKNIETVLDTMCDNKEIQHILINSLKAPWDENEEIRFFDKAYTLPAGVMFGAITEFIEASEGEIDVENLKRWIRIVWNCIEGQLFRNVNEMVSLGRNLSQIIRFHKATMDLYQAMTKVEVKSDSHSLQEEINKARMIVQQRNMDWENIFIETEKHPFFRGSIGWFLFAQPSETPEEFKHRAEIIGSMFDKGGIVDELRNEHKLIIAMIRQLNSFENLKGSGGYIHMMITECVDSSGKTKHLKSFLNDKHAVQEMFCRVGDMSTKEDAITEISRIANEENISFDDSSLKGEKAKAQIQEAFHRLTTDRRIYDFIKENEDIGYSVSFSYLDYTSYVVHVSKSPYRKIVIDSDRRLIISRIINDLGYSPCDKSQAEFYEKYNDYFGARVQLAKNERPEDIKLEFFYSDTINVFVHEPKEGLLEAFPEHNEINEEGWVTLKQISYKTEDEYDNIVKELKEIEHLYYNS